MAVISKQEIRIFFHEPFMKVVKYSASTEKFTIDLPKEVHKKMGKSVCGVTLKEANQQFAHALAMFDEVNTKVDKIIIVKREITVKGKSPVDGKNYDLSDIGYEERDGVGVTFSCGVFMRHTTKVPGWDDKVDYEFIDAGFPKGFEGIEDEWNFGEDAYLKLPWNQETEDGLKRLAEGLKLLAFKLLAVVKTKKTMLEFISTGQKLLESGKSNDN